MSSAFHPKTDGRSEISNKSVTHCLQSVLIDKTKWVDKLAVVEFAINTTFNKSIRMTPYEYLYGFNPTLSFKSSLRSTNSAASDFALDVKNTLQLAKDNLALAKVEQGHFANLHQKNSDTYVVGD